jgi:hypothetical protein
MIDAMNSFGSIALTGTSVTLPNVINFGQVDPRESKLKGKHRTGEQHDSTVVFNIDADSAAAISVMKLQHSDDGSTFTDLMTGTPTGTNNKAGIVGIFEFPKVHKQYVQAVVTGGTAGVNMRVWFQPGHGEV